MKPAIQIETGSTILETGSTVRFNAKLLLPEVAEKDGQVAILPLSKDANAEFPSKGTTMVEGTIDGFPFRAPLEPKGEGNHCLRISQALQDAAGVKEGGTATVEITRIGDEPEVRAPKDLLEALAKAPSVVQALWEEITPMARREWIRWVASAKQESTRKKRIEVGIDKLSKGMRRPCCFPGLNWVTKDLVAPDETWMPLPNSKGRSS